MHLGKLLVHHYSLAHSRPHSQNVKCHSRQARHSSETVKCCPTLIYKGTGRDIQIHTTVSASNAAKTFTRQLPRTFLNSREVTRVELLFDYSLTITAKLRRESVNLLNLNFVRVHLEHKQSPITHV